MTVLSLLLLYDNLLNLVDELFRRYATRIIIMFRKLIKTGHASYEKIMIHPLNLTYFVSYSKHFFFSGVMVFDDSIRIFIFCMCSSSKNLTFRHYRWTTRVNSSTPKFKTKVHIYCMYLCRYVCIKGRYVLVHRLIQTLVNFCGSVVLAILRT